MYEGMRVCSYSRIRGEALASADGDAKNTLAVSSLVEYRRFTMSREHRNANLPSGAFRHDELAAVYLKS